ncbi:MAG: ester cyclase [Candidatus Thermoplasmatota archaeon]|jgi:predicted ester cyclase|nr:ester cyclase [Candidatus Thermoplasmatota archaeon]
MSSVEDLNERLVRSWVNDVLKGGGKSAEEWLFRIRESAPDYYDENYVAHHDPTSKGREGLLTRFASLAYAFSDVEVDLVQLFAKGDMVADCIRITGNHTGHFLGIPPTGRKISWLQNEIFRLKDGRIVEGWVTRDWLGLFQQLGAFGNPK